jgi:hypothetical protein
MLSDENRKLRTGMKYDEMFTLAISSNNDDVVLDPCSYGLLSVTSST